MHMLSFSPPPTLQVNTKLLTLAMLHHASTCNPRSLADPHAVPVLYRLVGKVRHFSRGSATRGGFFMQMPWPRGLLPQPAAPQASTPAALAAGGRSPVWWDWHAGCSVEVVNEHTFAHP